MRGEPREDVVGILPDSLRHDQRAVWIDPREHLQSFLGRADEAVAAAATDSVRPLECATEFSDCCAEFGFELLLGRPADAVGLFT